MNEKHVKLGTERSAIRELFEYGKLRAEQVGKENVFDFSLGNPSVPAPPCVHEQLKALLEEVPAEILHGYTSATGDGEARKTISQYLQQTYGAHLPAELIYMTCGAAAALTCTLGALLSGGEEVIVLSPYFPEYRVFIEGAGGVCKQVKTDSAFRPDLKALEEALTKNVAAIIINTPNNPTGVVYREEELKALAALLEQKSEELQKPVYLISDEPYRELAYEKTTPFVANYYKNTVVCYSFSKSLSLAGERIGYVAINEGASEAQKLFAGVCGAGRKQGYVCAPALFQRVVARCLGQTSDKSMYQSNGDLLYEALTKMGYEAIRPQGAFYLFVKAPEGDGKAFSERAKKYNVLVVPSDTFGVKGYVRISTCVPTERIIKALPAFEKLIKE